MKFGKEFSSQMVPEWQQAYMDYDYLKTLLKEIIRFKLRTNNAPTRGGAKNHQGGGLNRKMTLYRAFSGLVSTPGRHRRGNPHDVEEGIQLTGTTTTSGPILVNNTADRGYETTFLMAAEEGGEYELMDALIAFRVKVENPEGWGWDERAVEITRLASDIATSAAVDVFSAVYINVDVFSAVSCSWFGFVMLHIIMYAANLYFWRRYKVNYSKIFNFKQGTELGHRQVLLVAFSIGVFALLCVLANLDMEVDPETKDYQAVTELLPLFVLIGIFGVLFLPFKLFYYSNRIFYLTCLFHCIAAPLYEVSFSDSFFCAQFTSQVQALRSFAFYICYYGWGDFKHRKNTCAESNAYKSFFFIVAVIPFVTCLLQCLRRLVDEKHKNTDHRWNGVKHFLTIVAVCFRTAYSIQPGQNAWRVIAIIFSVVAAIFGTYWDFVHDWGLLNRTSENPWLRDKLLIPQKKVYFIAMILNVLLRFAWIQTVLDFKLPFKHSTQTMLAVVASLEIIRRGIWNFFRLENKHLNNVREELSTINGGDKRA
ncbi:unnamed protein product [Brassica rapa subsp. narinosa]